MRVLVISDTHGKLREMQELCERIQPDLLIHLGDLQMNIETVKEILGCPIEFVPGNCDAFSSWSYSCENTKVISIGPKIRAYLAHGHRHLVNYGPQRIYEEARNAGCSLVLYGHTHVQLLEHRYDMTILNPGSLNSPRDDSRGGYAIITTDRSGAALYSLERYSERK